jgi:hypothetical protein
LSSSSFQSFTSFKFVVKDVGFSFSVLNIYGPYAERIPYWDYFPNVISLNDHVTLVGGDLNFILSYRELLGESPRLDAQSIFFIYFMENITL